MRMAKAALVAIALIGSPSIANAQAPEKAVAPADSVDNLARDISRLEAVRQVKNLQRSYAQYAQFGLWADMVDLFSRQGRVEWGDRKIEGRGAISTWLQDRGGPAGLAPGGLHSEFIDQPLINLSVDGKSAKGRWMGLAFLGDGKGGASFEGGVYENSYVLEDGRWKIAALHYYPQYEGPYAEGWANVGNQDLPIVPFHFTPDSAGIPIPAAQGTAPKSNTSIAALAARMAALNDEDAVRNLQHSYGYYLDRKMWDDIVDLFADDGVVEIAGVGTFSGKAGARRALELMGPAGLAYGELNDRPIFDTIVAVSPGGQEAYTRGSELAMRGHADKKQASWEINVFRNRFVKQGGIWKIREMRIQPIMKADYALGWGAGAVSGTPRIAMPALLGPNPATGKPVDTLKRALFATTALTGAVPSVRNSAKPTLTDIRRRYQRSLAYEGSENVSAAYGFYLDDFQWTELSSIFAVEGNKQSPFAGYYLGRDRIMAAAKAMWGPAPPKRPGISYHWRTQPVIHVSHDGRSANLRTRLFQPRTAKWDSASGKPNNVGFHAGMYPNDQVVIEDGIWRLWTLTIDEHYFTSPNWKGGWSAAVPPPGGASPSPLLTRYPPDILLTALGKRMEGFRGGTGETIDWPGILPMWFHYRNPVSGRMPERYWPDCVPCEILPGSRMTNHGYQMPPNGPEIDGIEIR